MQPRDPVLQVTSMSDMITATDLVKVYGDGTEAVQGISFEVREGEFFGFLGPNGAGKTTTIKILTTLLRKTSGSVTVAGLNLERDAKGIRRVIGVQSQEIAIDEDLTATENMILQGHLQGLRGDELLERVDELLGIVDLKDAANKRAALFSGGMKKRLDLASALVHHPRILFLDEPTTGLDPQSRASVWSYLKRLNKEEGITIFLTTQYMEEADRLCERVSIVDYGKIVAQGSPSELKQHIGADAIGITLENTDALNNGLRERAKHTLGKFNTISNVIDSDSGLTVYTKNGAFMIPEIVRAFDEEKMRISSLNLSTPTLDDVFLKYTGRRIRPEELKKPASSGMMFRRR